MDAKLGLRKGIWYDLCVIGSGPAGLSFASQFLDKTARGGPKVAVLEAGESTDAAYSNELGGHDISKRYSELSSEWQQIYDGRVDGWLHLKKPTYLTESRLRAFGGTGNVWSGWWCSLEPDDLVRGNWPIAPDALTPHYQEACALFDLPSPFCVDRGELDKPFPHGPESASFRTRRLLSKRINFGQRFKSALGLSDRVDLLLNVNVTELVTVGRGDQGKHVHCLRAKIPTRAGGYAEIDVFASTFVIATGCIEATRLLLESDIGVASGHLGRFFQEHFCLWNAGKFDVRAPSSSQLFRKEPEPCGAGAKALTMVVPTAPFLAKSDINAFRVLLGGAPDIPGTLNISWEQQPAFENLVRLDTARPDNPLAQRGVLVYNEFGPRDAKTLRAAIEGICHWLESQGLGSGFLLPDLSSDPMSWPDPYRIAPGNHPSGTTRMSDDPSKGVVNSNCRVHECANLYIASSSVFPSAGYANPTLTIIAMALRLAEHLKGIGV